MKLVYKGLFIKAMSVGLVEVLFFKDLFILLTNGSWLFQKLCDVGLQIDVPTQIFVVFK
jgi:hypothetical protein